MTFPENKKIILFDGLCNLCDNAVSFLIEKDNKNCFVFCSIQSEMGKQILNHIGIDPKKIDSIVLFEPNIAYYIKSNAALEIAGDLSFFYQLLSVFKIFPLKFRDRIYDYIAENRYKWYGKKESCMIPDPELMKKFLQ